MRDGIRGETERGERESKSEGGRGGREQRKEGGGEEGGMRTEQASKRKKRE